MSMKTPFAAEIPEETRRLVEPLLVGDSVYRLVGNEIAIVMRLDWKYALRQELTWTGFHYSDLCHFRRRLLEHEREWVVFERLVTYLQERGYIKGRGKQRTDATKIVGYVARLSRLELVWETIRVTVRALVDADASWVNKYLPISFVDSYSQRRWDYRLSKAKIRLRMAEAGQEGYWLLGQVEGYGSDELKELVEVNQLRRVLAEQSTRGEDGETKPRPPGEAKGDVITTPP